MPKHEGRDPRNPRHKPAEHEAKKDPPAEREMPPPVTSEYAAIGTADHPPTDGSSSTGTATAPPRGPSMTNPPFTFDSGISLPVGLADARFARARQRSVLGVQPPSDTPDGFVARALGDISTAAGGSAKVKDVTEALIREGLTEEVAKATAKLNAGGIDRTQRLLLATSAVYASILEEALGSVIGPTTPTSTTSGTGGFAPVPRRRVDFADTAGLVSFVLRALDRAGGFREQYGARLVDAVTAGRGLNVTTSVRAAVVSDVSLRELPAASSKVDELVVGLINRRRATLDVESAIDEYARGGEIDPIRFTPAVRDGMVTFLQDIGVTFPAGGVTPSNRAQFDEYFALAYNNAIRSGNGATADPIDVVRQKGATTSWNFEVDTFDTIEEQGVVPQNILAAGALDYVYNIGERLGVFKLADALVLRWANGAFDAPPGKPSADLYRYWKLRPERVSPEERAMMYRRILAKGEGNLLSGMVENEPFPTLWGGLMEKATDFIHRSEENASTDRTVSRQPSYQATKQLQYNLTEYATGMAHMQITEMYFHLDEARKVLEYAIPYFSTGSRNSLWNVIERASREWFDEAPNISAIRSAAVDGNRVFQWIASFDQSSVTDDQFQAFLEAAEAWIIAAATDDSEPSVGEEADEEEDEDIDSIDKEINDDWDK